MIRASLMNVATVCSVLAFFGLFVSFVVQRGLGATGDATQDGAGFVSVFYRAALIVSVLLHHTPLLSRQLYPMVTVDRDPSVQGGRALGWGPRAFVGASLALCAASGYRGFALAPLRYATVVGKTLLLKFECGAGAGWTRRVERLPFSTRFLVEHLFDVIVVLFICRPPNLRLACDRPSWHISSLLLCGCAVVALVLNQWSEWTGRRGLRMGAPCFVSPLLNFGLRAQPHHTTLDRNPLGALVSFLRPRRDPGL